MASIFFVFGLGIVSELQGIGFFSSIELDKITNTRFTFNFNASKIIDSITNK